MDIRTLKYWHKIEHFYPYILQGQDNKNIKTNLVSSENNFPSFLQPDVPAGKIVRYYGVYLGIFYVDPALAALEEGIGGKMRFRDCGNDESCFCMFHLASDGTFLPDSFQISSFPWAIHRVRDGKIIIDHWEDDFLQFQKEIFEYLSAYKEPHSYHSLCEFRDFFAKRINWKIEYCDDWMRIDMVSGDIKEQSGSASDTEETSNDQEEIDAENDATDEAFKKNNLLNSFFVRDLERVIDAISADASKCSKSLQCYLNHKAQNTIDIEKNSNAMFSLMSPKNLPLGRWPSDYGARLMQQLDVNAFLTTDASFSQPLFSVNGPPGTGKTTLLKDIVAAIITDRAEQFLPLETPDAAFESAPIGSIMINGYRNNIWQLRQNFIQHGILITSSNNGAVENITHEMPAISELPKKYQCSEYKYFSEISDQIFGKGKTWGLNAAALGKKKNCKKLVDKLWPLDKDYEGHNFRVELQRFVKQYNAERWEKAKTHFREKKASVLREYDRINAVYKTAERLRTLCGQIHEAEKALAQAREFAETSRKKHHASAYAVKQAEERLNQLNKQADEIRNATPLLHLHIFFMPRSPIATQYKKVQKEEEKLLVCELPELRQRESESEKELRNLEQQIENQEMFLREKRHLRDAMEKELEDFRIETGMPFRIDAFFSDCGANDHSKISPWGYQRLNELREKLFFAALELHRVFVISSSHMKDNIDGYSKVLRGMISPAQAQVCTAPLLQSFFLMVPVVSTTFASVGTFLKNIPSGEIAYLFIDEAGQAMPQAAVGALWRARKAIAVGDPLQIEPVATLHDKVIELLGQYYQQEELLLNKYTSVQSVCDLANRIGGWRTVIENNDLWVGAPLIVHSRCQYPVYDIANRIAYNNKMIFDSKVREGVVCCWLETRGNAETGHYVPVQAKEAMPYVIDAFKQYAKEKENERKYPSIFVITPFRSVRAGVADYFRNHLQNELTRRGIDIEKNCIQEWIKECIGTIHTFQGKEANTVILCLGVDSSRKGSGAVDWAGERPNILNVAVTRSKHKLYIIGDPNVWCRKSYFKVAHDVCADFSGKAAISVLEGI